MTPKDLQAIRNRRWYLLNKKKSLAASRLWAKRNPEIDRARKKAWDGAHPGCNSARVKAWRSNPLNRARRNSQEKQRRAIDPQTAMLSKIRNRINTALRRYFHRPGKSDTTIQLLGCNFTQLKTHLSNQFSSGMSWENYNRTGWHIDHKRPCASFDLTVPAQQRECFHYTNLQPLWAVDNLRKGAKWQPQC